MNATEEAKELLYGNITEVELPSGFWVKIREQNGEDDDIISNPVLAKDLRNVSIFLSSLIIETNLPFSKNGRLSVEDIDKMLVNDQAVILLASRINSLGADLKFTFDWGEKGGKYDYHEELDKYLWKYITHADDFPWKEGDPDYFEYRCKPYPPNAYEPKTFTLNSGKEIQMKHMDVESQKELLNLTAEKVTKNREFIIRDLKLYQNGNWTKVEQFKFFSSRDMQEMRTILSTYDAPFKGLTYLENPGTGESTLYQFMSNPNFFFPGETEI